MNENYTMQTYKCWAEWDEESDATEIQGLNPEDAASELAERIHSEDPFEYMQVNVRDSSTGELVVISVEAYVDVSFFTFREKC